MLKSYIVTSASGERMQFYAEDEAHAFEQAEDADPSALWISADVCTKHNATVKATCTFCGALGYFG